MIASMTGFGRSEKIDGNISCTIEIKSVNHRYIDISLRMPRNFIRVEDKIKKIIREKFSRGYFEIFLSINNNIENTKELTPNIKLVEQYIKAFEEIKTHFNVSGTIDINSVIQLKDILIFEEKDDNMDLFWQMVNNCLLDAIDLLKNMREAEGKALTKDIIKRIEITKNLLKHIEGRGSIVLLAYKDKLNLNLKNILDGKEIDQNRLSEELAIFAERCDITEEIIRLNNHLNQFLIILTEKNAVGRKLEFLIQEINREINTIGSKANDYKISEDVIGMKSEFEKIREQVQNIE